MDVQEFLSGELALFEIEAEEEACSSQTILLLFDSNVSEAAVKAGDVRDFQLGTAVIPAGQFVLRGDFQV